jgi:hypothetical protein
MLLDHLFVDEVFIFDDVATCVDHPHWDSWNKQFGFIHGLSTGSESIPFLTSYHYLPFWALGVAYCIN